MDFVCINGELLPENQALIPINDRGLQFGDSVYEVIMVFNGKMVDQDWHFARLNESIQAIYMPEQNIDSMIQDCHLLIAKNKLSHGYVYLQVTRGCAPRQHEIPQNSKPNIIVSTTQKILSENLIDGIKVCFSQESRWKHRNIKTCSLLATVLLKHKALIDGYDDTIICDEDEVLEGSRANIFIVDQKDRLITTPNDNRLLPGITKRRIANLHKVTESKITKIDLLNAKEVFLSSSTNPVKPILQIEDTKINNGIVGPMAKKIHNNYMLWLNGAFYE